jgi:hypothetical protein
MGPTRPSLRVGAKPIATVAVFSALTISLNPISIPAPFLPNFPYRFWDIPIIVAFFLFGFKIAFSVAVLNSIGQLLLFPRPIGIVAPIWFLIAITTLLLGLFLTSRLLKKRNSGKMPLSKRKHAAYYTTLGIASRLAILPFVDYTMYRAVLPLVLGGRLSDAVILSFIPGEILFIITSTFYMVPIGYFIARKVNTTLELTTDSIDIMSKKL